MEDGAPVSADTAVGSEGEPPPDLSVQPVPLPVLHRDVSGERVEEVDVAIVLEDVLPVGLAHHDNVEQAAALDLDSLIGIAVVGDDVPGSPEREMATW